MTKVVVVDFGLSNINSIKRGLEHVGAAVLLSSDPNRIADADRLVLPGVGAFEYGMKALRDHGVVNALRDFAKSGRPLLGICLGMQLLLEHSEEDGKHQGLGIIPGAVVQISQMEGGKRVRKVPHIGWNALSCPSHQNNWKDSLLSNNEVGDFFYFVHSFMAIPVNSSDVLAQCEYEGLSINAAVKSGNVTGFQFHPEKSGELGLKILKEFVQD